MNILLFTFAMLLLLTTLSYSSMQQLRQSLLTHIEYHTYLKSEAEMESEDVALTVYKDQVVNSTDSGSEGPRLKSKLSAGGLVSTKKREAETYVTIRAILVRLIPDLYQNEEFYREMLARKADEQGLNETQVIERLLEGITAYANRVKVSRDSDLLKVDFDDPVLRNGFAKMLNGKGYTEEIPGSYPSILDFISIQGTKPVSLYLAKGPLLQAIFQDPVAVQRLQEGRMEIYRQLTSVPAVITKEDGTEQMKLLVRGNLRITSDEELFDYGVSTTRPPTD